jgi:hypothetical protein
MDNEKQALTDSLTRQRGHVLGILEGLSEDQLRRPMLPSGWSPLTMVKHLAWDNEHYWFRCIIGGESLESLQRGDEGHVDAWELQPGESAEDVFTMYRDEIERSDTIIAAATLDAPPRQRDEWWGDWQVPDVRFIILHMITETACHAGHLDAARELLDGRQWVVL